MNNVAHIIAGGPSARNIPFHELVGPVIGINDSYFNAPCDYVVSIDGQWQKRRWQRLKDLKAKGWMRRDTWDKHVGAENAWPEITIGDCKIWEPGPGPGLHQINGNNGGLVALHYAYHLGHKTFFIYGFDMNIPEGQTKHWYQDYEWPAKGNGMYPEFIKACDITAKLFKDKGLTVFNVSPQSKLECFQKVTYEQAKNLFCRIY